MLKTLKPEISALIPVNQYKVMNKNIYNFQKELLHLKNQFEICPKLHETSCMAEHPAIFHYFNMCYDLFICEYSKEKDEMYGLQIFNSDIKKSKWVYYDVSFITKLPLINLEYNFGGHSIEALLYRIYPQYLNKPLSLHRNKN